MKTDNNTYPIIEMSDWINTYNKKNKISENLIFVSSYIKKLKSEYKKANKAMHDIHQDNLSNLKVQIAFNIEEIRQKRLDKNERNLHKTKVKNINAGLADSLDSDITNYRFNNFIIHREDIYRNFCNISLLNEDTNVIKKKYNVIKKKYKVYYDEILIKKDEMNLKNIE